MKFFESAKVTSLPIFAGVNPDTIQEILGNAQKEQFVAGETIMEQGEHPNKKGYIIESGKVQVVVDETETAQLSSGEMFGEIALLNEEPRTATVVAQEDVTVVVISQDMLFEMIENDDNSINKEIMRRMEENLEMEERNM